MYLRRRKKKGREADEQTSDILFVNSSTGKNANTNFLSGRRWVATTIKKKVERDVLQSREEKSTDYRTILARVTLNNPGETIGKYDNERIAYDE